MLREYIYPGVRHVGHGCPARWYYGAAAGFPGSPPGDAPPAPLPLVWLRRVGLWRLESGRCNLTDAANLLSHPGTFA